MIVILIFILSFLKSSNEAENKCLHVKLNDCDDVLNKRYTYLVYYQSFVLTDNCPTKTKDYSITWRFLNNNSETIRTKSNTHLFIMGPNTASAGFFKIKIDILKGRTVLAEDTCHIRYWPEPPTLIPFPANFQTVRFKDRCEINYTGSINYDILPLNPTWQVKCVKNKQPPTGINCDKAKCFRKPPTGLLFNFGLHACFRSYTISGTQKFDDSYVYANGIVHGSKRRSAYKFVIGVLCIKNCDKSGSRYANPKLAIRVKLVCYKGCEFYKYQQIVWKARGDRKGSYGYSIFKKIDKFTGEVLPNTFLDEDSVQVEAGNQKSFPQIQTIKIAPTKANFSCEIDPKSGQSMKTKFAINCTVIESYLKQYKPIYQLYQKSEPEDNLLLESAFNTFHTLLGSQKNVENQELYVTARDPFGNEYRIDITNVTVERLVMTEDILKELIQEFQEDCANGNTPAANQVAHVILEEMKNNNVNASILENTYKIIMQTLQEASVDNEYLYLQMSRFVETFMTVRTDASEEYSQILQKFCKKIGDLNLYTLTRSKYPGYNELLALEQAEILRRCGQNLIVRIETQVAAFHTTPFSVVTEPAIKEDYPDYGETTEINGLRVEVMNLIKTSGLIVATSMIAGESKVGLNENKSEKSFHTQLYVEEGNDMVKKKFELPNALVRPGNTFNGRKEVVTTVITEYKGDFLKGNQVISTSIVDISFYNINHEKITPLVSDLEIQYDIPDIKISGNDYILNVPSNKLNWKYPDMEYKVNIHRINLLKKTKCVLLFTNVPIGDILQVIYIRDRRPGINDFYNKKYRVYTVEGHNDTVLKFNCPFAVDHNSDRFIYIGVLPHNVLLTNETNGDIAITYQLEISILSCLQFNTSSTVWDFDRCESSLLENGTNSKIICSCKHLSIFAATFFKVENRDDQAVLVNFTIVPPTNFIIFLVVAFQFLLYCLLLIYVFLGSKEVVKQSNIYFLTDNIINERFAYLIVVKTGGKYKSGTTSNVLIKLYGSNYASKPHVLNFPDPFQLLLQKGNSDWFCLSSDKYLGEILFVQLWFDSIGVYPTWYCEEIEVIDLQTKVSYFFDVNTWFDLSKKKIDINLMIPSTNDKDLHIGVATINRSSRFYYGGENTWNIFAKKDLKHLSTLQRACVIFSLISTNYLVVLLYLHRPALRSSDAFGIESVTLGYHLIYLPLACSIISEAINFPFMFFFRNSVRIYKQNVNQVLIKEEKKYSKKVTERTWLALYGWQVFCLVLLTIFGITVPMNTVITWAIITTEACILCAFITESVFQAIYTILTRKFNMSLQKVYNFNWILNEIEVQRKHLIRKFGEVQFRPYFHKHYIEPDKEEIEDMRYYQQRRAVIADNIREFALFCFFVIIVYIIVLSRWDDLAHISNTSHRNIFINGKYSNYSINKIANISDIYNYLNKTIVATIHPSKWYGDYNVIDGGLIADFNSKLLGVVRLRQQRKNDSCTIPEELKGLDLPCEFDYKTFANWTDFSDPSTTTSMFGELHYYDGTGFVIYLGRNLYNSWHVLRNMQNINWIDMNTVLIAIEFWTYNANQNLFNSVRILIEKDGSGRIAKSYNIYTLKLFFADDTKNIFIEISLFILIIVIIVMIIRRIVFIVVYRAAIFTNFWAIVDSILFTLSILLVFMHYYADELIQDVLFQILNAQNNEFIQYLHIIQLEYLESLVAGLLLALTTIRLWKILRLYTIFQIMERAVVKSISNLTAAMIWFLILLSAISLHLYIACHKVETFSTLTNAYIFLSFVSLQIFKIDFKVIGQRYVGAYVIYPWYMLASMVTQFLFIIIIIDKFEESEVYFSNRMSVYEIKDYVKEEIAYKKGMYRRRKFLRLKSGGGDEFMSRSLVYPKAPAQRYADCFILTDRKFHLMQQIAICVFQRTLRFKRQTRLSRNDYKTMAKIIYLMGSPDLKPINTIFFIHKVPDKQDKYLFVSDIKLQRMEFITKALLGEERRRSRYIGPSGTMHISGDSERLHVLCKIMDNINKILENIMY